MKERCLAVVVGAVLALSACSDSGGDGQCAPPYFSVSPPTVSASGDLRIKGQDFIDGCSDNITVLGGVQMREATKPFADIEVTWHQGDHSVVLGTVSADDEGAWQLDVSVPPEAEVGTAEISVGDTFWNGPEEVEVTP